jgi:hypothetical protein
MDSPDERLLKRKRSPDSDHHMSLPSAPLAKSARTSSHLAINYLARQLHDDLPLVTVDDPLPVLLQLLGEYAGVLDRHESLALNLGARPLGPILIKRFERLFDGPPKVLKTHSKEGGAVTWLDVVEFARNKPEQFTLAQMSEGMRVCQFYTKQCRVQISEEDYVLISSGMPQKLIPPQPVVEDEEKELGTLEIMERNLTSVCQMADQGTRASHLFDPLTPSSRRTWPPDSSPRPVPKTGHPRPSRIRQQRNLPVRESNKHRHDERQWQWQHLAGIHRSQCQARRGKRHFGAQPRRRYRQHQV